MRSSTHPLTNPSRAFTRTLGRQFSVGFLAKRRLHSTEQDISPEGWLNDFEEVTYDELSSLALEEDQNAVDQNHQLSSPSSIQTPSSPISNPFATPTDYQTPSTSAFLRPKTLSRSSFTESINRVSSRLSSRTRLSSRPKHRIELDTLCLDFPQPPTHIPTPVASAHIPSDPNPAFSTSVNAAPLFLDFDPFRSEFVLDTDLLDLSSRGLDREEREKSPDSVPSPSRSVANTVKGRGRFTRLKRFKTLTKETFLTSLRTPVSELSSSGSVRSRRARSLRHFGDSTAPDSVPAWEPHSRQNPPRVPTLILDNVDLTASPLAEPELSLQPTIVLQPPSPESLATTDLLFENKPIVQSSAFVSHQLPSPVRYEFVDPASLTDSPFSFANSSLLNASTRTSFIPPSPSWLSRNVQGLENFDFRSILPSPSSQSRTPFLFDLEGLKPSPVDCEANFVSALFHPDSPLPLPIPPPIIIAPPIVKRHPKTHSIVRDTDADTTSVRESILTIESCPASILTPSSQTVPISSRASISSPTLSQSPSYKHSSIESNRHLRSADRRSFRLSSAKENKVSLPLHGLFTFLLTYRRFQESLLLHLSKALILLNCKCRDVMCHVSKVISTVSISFYSYETFNHLTRELILFFPLAIQESSELNTAHFPTKLSRVIFSVFLCRVCYEHGVSFSSDYCTMNFFGKTEETVDFGGEVDYAGYQWFQDAPPKQEVRPIF